ncbi:MAG: sugar phosphate nucleotidyltransferase [Acidimicrobiales bacterium]
MEPNAASCDQFDAAGLVGVVLAAGIGARLAPLSRLRPKALCPVGNRALVDLALDRLMPLVGACAVNAHHQAEQLCFHMENQWGKSVKVSEERSEALGTAGAIANLRDWIDGRGVVVLNADGWSPASIRPLLEGWDRDTLRVLISRSHEFGPKSQVVASTIPWWAVKQLEVRPTGLYEVLWKNALGSGDLEVIHQDGPFIDCGTPQDYLEANLFAATANGGTVVHPNAQVDNGVNVAGSVIGAGARIHSDVVDSVVWPDQIVDFGEELIRSIRAGTSVTVGPL